MGVDYGMAMTGFDIRGGRSIPRFEGIVVCEEYADQVEQEWEEEQEYVTIPRLIWQQSKTMPMHEFCVVTAVLEEKAFFLVSRGIMQQDLEVGSN